MGYFINSDGTVEFAEDRKSSGDRWDNTPKDAEVRVAGGPVEEKHNDVITTKRRKKQPDGPSLKKQIQKIRAENERRKKIILDYVIHSRIGSTIQCPVCHKTLEIKPHLKIHFKVCFNSKSFALSVYNKLIGKSNSKQVHYKRTERPNTFCDICGHLLTSDYHINYCRRI